MRPFVFDIGQIDLVQAYVSIKHIPYSLFLDSSDTGHHNSRYSFVMSHPIETIEIKNSNITSTTCDGKTTSQEEPFLYLSKRIKHWINNTEKISGLPPFQGGAAGLFSYDLCRSIEKIPQLAIENNHTPDLAVGIYDQVLAYDNLLNKCWIITHARNEAEAEKKREFFLNLISTKYIVPSYTPINLEWVSNFKPNEYIDQVNRVIEYIHAGDIFQANITQRFEALLPENFDAFLHYIKLRKTSPAPFSCFMNLGEIKISSISPERFLSVEDNCVETCPIKGTRPHLNDIVIDKRLRNDLLNSEKDRAENIMIVDLLRNDISRVCVPSSVIATDICKLETFSYVHHLVSTIRGKLRPDKNCLDLLKAAFPGGSITGAPKIRAMEIIESIEPERRGAYCGSIGYIGFDGTMDTNILIRTLVYNNNKVFLQVGGGIVADSNPKTEYQETLDKAEAIFRSF